jgi:hypothetical protein
MDYATAIEAQGSKQRADAIIAMVMAQVQQGYMAFSVQDLADARILGKSECYEEIARGRLLAVKRGRSTLILAPDLISYLQSLALIPPHPPDRKPDPKAIARGKLGGRARLAALAAQRKTKPTRAAQPAPRHRKRRA